MNEIPTTLPSYRRQIDHATHTFDMTVGQTHCIIYKFRCRCVIWELNRSLFIEANKNESTVDYRSQQENNWWELRNLYWVLLEETRSRESNPAGKSRNLRRKLGQPSLSVLGTISNLACLKGVLNSKKVGYVGYVVDMATIVTTQNGGLQKNIMLLTQQRRVCLPKA